MSIRRPPIIISSGSGIAGVLAEGLKSEDGREAWKVIADNVDKLNERITGENSKNLPIPVAMSLEGTRKGRQPLIYWRLETDKACEDCDRYRRNQYSETGAHAR